MIVFITIIIIIMHDNINTKFVPVAYDIDKRHINNNNLNCTIIKSVTISVTHHSRLDLYT